MSWFAYALISAAAAAATAILAKLGVEGVPSTLATAIRTVVVVTFTWGLVLTFDQQEALRTMSRRTLMFLVLSGVATGYRGSRTFRALQMAPASWVAPIDKLSLPLSIVFAVVFLREPLTWQIAGGVALMLLGALITRA